MNERIYIYLGFSKFRQIWTDVKADTFHGAGQRDATDQKNSEQHVWKEGSKIDNFASPLDALPDTKVTDYPY